MIKKKLVLTFVNMLIVCLIFSAVSFAQTEEQDLYRPGVVNPDVRTLWIGVLKGTWREMGIQYGQRAAKDIAWAFDVLWEKNVLGWKQPWHEGKTDEELALYAVKYMERQLEELSYLSPELVDFYKGIGLGAAHELRKTKYNTSCPNDLLKIGFLNNHDIHFHPNWDFENDRPGVKSANLQGVTLRPNEITADVRGDCNALWVSGEGTITGETYANRHTHSSPVAARQVAYVAIPQDPNARVFWGAGIAGALGGLGGGLLNDYGVCILTAGGQQKEGYAQPDETLAPGIKDFWLGTLGVIFCKTAREAAELVTRGTPEYRAKTGRETVLRGRGCNLLFGDPNEALVVECNANWFLIREAGEADETGNYLIVANHFMGTNGSVDENNVFHPDKPMDRWSPDKWKEGKNSSYRYWTASQFLNENYGEITLEMIMDFAGAHQLYNKQGNLVSENASLEGVSAWCCHRKVSEEHPLGKITSASHSVPVFNLTTREVWWVPIWPCYYNELNMDWNHIDLKPYAEYRQLLWGY